MNQNSDLIDLLRALNAEDAKYLIVGGYALAYHGRVRATKDTDIFIGIDASNARKVWRALAAFGAPIEELQESDLATAETFFIMGRAPNQIDIITTIDGVDFERAWKNRSDSHYGEVPVHFIGRDDLVANKSATGRPQDELDVRSLRDLEGDSE